LTSTTTNSFSFHVTGLHFQNFGLFQARLGPQGRTLLDCYSSWMPFLSLNQQHQSTRLTTSIQKERDRKSSSDQTWPMAMGWVDPWVGLGWVQNFLFRMGWVGLGRVRSNMIYSQTALVNISYNHDYFLIPITFLFRII